MRPTDEYKTYCANFASAPTTSALDRIGARIPEEVLARISFLIQGEYHERRIVGHMALTCKYWATQCQPVIFNVIRLRSGKDLEELLSLMASPLSRVASYIKRLSLWQYGRPDAPWLHLVALRLVPKLSLNTEDPINLSFYNDDMISVSCEVKTSGRQFYIFYFILPSTTRPNTIVQVEIIGIIIREYKDGDSDKWNKTCEHLPPLQKLALGFSSKEDMTRFVQEVVSTKLHSLRSEDRVKYAVLQGEGENEMWSRASFDLEELKETGLAEDDLWRI
ncbi:hypothetical protein PHLCEN_2v11467 [Hermanssonia centrifuga]|uniref:Uncharacterized protein n=1 Tax=Hermanssonia centrifuga TaxID=98765 RepID=A0A2R6NJV6_9APHY|nr:hypothetical protein PHLCEN_2v11467 [Hermanssonia centrifuga]